MRVPFLSDKERDSAAPEKDSKAHLDGDIAAAPSRTEDSSIRGLSDLYFPEEPGESKVRDIADVLLDAKKITYEQHARCRQQQSQKPGSDVATLLLKEGIVSADEVLMAKAKLCGLEFRHITPDDVDKQAFEKLDIGFIKRSNIVPVVVEQDTLIIATSEPANIFAVEDVKRQTQMNLQVVVCSAEDIEAVCSSFQTESIDYNLDDIISDMTEVEVVQDQKDVSEDLEKMAGQSPVIKFVNYLISNAIHEGASDIHIEPKEPREQPSSPCGRPL